jgi:hypothetical protein
VLPGDPREHPLPEQLLPRGEGGRRDVDQALGPRPDELPDGI